jgi:hypothetical protein
MSRLLDGLDAQPWEVAALDQVMAEVEAQDQGDVVGDQLVTRKQPGDDDNGGAGPWNDSAKTGGNDHD